MWESLLVGNKQAACTSLHQKPSGDHSQCSRKVSPVHESIKRGSINQLIPWDIDDKECQLIHVVEVYAKLRSLANHYHHLTSSRRCM